MSSSGTCTLFEVENIVAPCHPEHEVVEVLDSSYYDHALPISETYEFDFASHYIPHHEEPPIVEFPPLSTYFTPEPENLPGSQPGSPPRTLHSTLQIPTPLPPHQGEIPNRPHSSPSIFQPNPEAVVEWPSESLPHPRSDDEESPSSIHQPVTPGPTPTPTPRHRTASSLSSLAEFQNQAPRRQYTPIAPNPAGLRQLQAQAQAQAQKRAASEDEWESPSSKRIRSIPPSPQYELTEEDTFLLKLKEDEDIPWKEITSRFQSKFGKQFQVPALQMRLKRIRERMRVWTENDVHALKMSHDWWLSQKFEIISSKMAEFGATEKWTSKQCSRKWSELSYSGDSFFNPMIRTPTFSSASYTASPIEGPPQGFTLPFPPITASFAENRTFSDTLP